MNDSIANVNKIYLDDWISINPNLKGFSFNNNILTTATGNEIDFKNFLASELINNKYFDSLKYSMTAFEFIRFINTFITTFSILNDNSNNVDDEYIINIKINGSDLDVITNKNNYIIDTKNYSNIFLLYNDMNQQNPYVSFSKFKNELLKQHINITAKKEKIEETKYKNVRFFSLINQEKKLTKSEKEYVENVLSFILSIKYNPQFETGIVAELISLFNSEIIYLSSIESDKLNDIQKHVLDSSNQFEENYIKQFEAQQKEALSIQKASLGYSSLVLIVTSVLTSITILFIMYILIS